MKTPDRPVDLTVDRESPLERHMQRRPELAAAVAAAAECLQRSPQWTQCAASVLRLLGEATGSGRVHIKQFRREAEGGLSAYRCATWAARPAKAQSDDDRSQPFDLVAAGCQQWLDVLAHGLAVEAEDSRLDQREVLRSRDMRALLALPLFANGQLWGMLAFASVTESSRFSRVEIDVLRPLAAALGASIERNELHAQVERLQRTEALGRMAGAIAHDFNNLLTVLSGAFETMALEPATKAMTEPDRVSLTNTVQQAIDQGARLLKRLMQHGRVTEDAPRELDVAAHLRGAESLLSQAVGRSIRLQIEVGAGSQHVCIDPLQLDQVLLNLALNARDAMPRGGTLAIEITKAASNDDGHTATWTVLRVRDNGHGMPAHVCEHIFDPYYTTKGNQRGTGIGLATVRAIVAAAGGHIAVRSAVGAGTEFCLYLPAIRHWTKEMHEGRAAS